MPDPRPAGSEEADLIDAYLIRAAHFKAEHGINFVYDGREIAMDFIQFYVDMCLRVRSISLDAGVRLLATHTSELDSDSDWRNEDLAPRS